MYVDVHTHLTHARFAEQVDEVVTRADDAGLGAIVVNGLEPESNRQVLAMAETHAVVLPALGIYPIDAVCNDLPEDFELDVARFDVDAEIAFIDLMRQARGQFDGKTLMAFERHGRAGEASQSVAKDLEMTPEAVRQAKHRVAAWLAYDQR